MKRNLAILLCAFLCMTVCLTVTVQAKTYSPGGTDLTISIDDTAWYVFTRDNIENNPELDELGISYEKIHEILYSNDAYMDAILYLKMGTMWRCSFAKKR